MKKILLALFLIFTALEANASLPHKGVPYNIVDLIEREQRPYSTEVVYHFPYILHPPKGKITKMIYTASVYKNTATFFKSKILYLNISLNYKSSIRLPDVVSRDDKGRDISTRVENVVVKYDSTDRKYLYNQTIQVNIYKKFLKRDNDYRFWIQAGGEDNYITLPARFVNAYLDVYNKKEK